MENICFVRFMHGSVVRQLLNRRERPLSAVLHRNSFPPTGRGLHVVLRQQQLVLLRATACDSVRPPENDVRPHANLVSRGGEVQDDETRKRSDCFATEASERV